MSYPEHDKVRAHQTETETVGEFLEWCEEKEIGLAYHDQDGRVPRLEELLAAWIGVDLKKFRAEKDAMITELRRANGYE